jgi:hypothetical protein
LERWQVLINEPHNAATIRGILQERLNILHRLNELGVKDIKGLRIVDALEETNVLIRELDRSVA